MIDTKAEVRVMRRNKKSLREAQQKRIVVLFCSMVAMVMTCFLLFNTTSTQAAPSEVTYKYYTNIQIKSGDTLWNIASEYATDEYSDVNEYIEEVCALNHISEDEIHAGQYLVIPYYSAEVIQ